MRDTLKAIAGLLGAGIAGVALLLFANGKASASSKEMPIQWERGHVGMNLDADGQEVVYMTVHGHECIVVGEIGGEQSPTLAISCDWGSK